MSPRRIIIIEFCTLPAVAKNNSLDGKRRGRLHRFKVSLASVQTAKALVHTRRGIRYRRWAARGRGAGWLCHQVLPGVPRHLVVPDVSVTYNTQEHLTRKIPRGRGGRAGGGPGARAGAGRAPRAPLPAAATPRGVVKASGFKHPGPRAPRRTHFQNINHTGTLGARGF